MFKGKKLAVLGCGNMSQALVKGVAKNFPELAFMTYTPTFTRAVELAQRIGGEAYEGASQMGGADIYLIACKPQQIEELGEEFRGVIPSEAFVISILAGTSVEKLQNALGVKRVMRVMPNTPSLLGLGVNLLYFPSELSTEEKEMGRQLMSAGAEIYETQSEDQLNALTGFTGSGPAYVFELTRAMAELMTEYGVSGDDAGRLMIQTVYGASELMKKKASSLEDLEKLRNQVASKKGVTQEALDTLEGEGFSPMFKKALKAAYKRADELSK